MQNRGLIHFIAVTIERNYDVIDCGRCRIALLGSRRQQHICRNWNKHSAVVERVSFLSTHSAPVRRIEDRIKQIGFLREWDLSCRASVKIDYHRHILSAMSRPVRDRGQEDLEVKRAVTI